MTTAVIQRPSGRIGGGVSKKKPPGGSVGMDEVLTKQAFLERVPWGKAAWARALRDGLKTTRQGGMTFVLGSDFHDFMRAQRDAQQAGRTDTSAK